MLLTLGVLCGAAIAVTLSPPVAAAQQPAPVTPTTEPCPPDTSLPMCHLPVPTSTPLPPQVPLPSPTQPPATGTSPPCTGMGCLPPPSGTTTPPTPGGQPTSQVEPGVAECGITDVGGCVTNAINGFFRGLVEGALNPLLELLSTTLLTTPTPESLPRLGELWHDSWQILLVSYTLLIMVGGVLVMSYETLQTRYSIKEIGPRVVLGFVAGALSWWLASQAIRCANALALAVLGEGVDPDTVGVLLRDLVMGSVLGELWLMLIGLVLAVMLVVLLVTYVVRVAVTVILIAGAPIALMCHALPPIEGVAWWWWRAFGGCLAIQGGQSLTLVTALKVFLVPDGFTVLGPNRDGLANLLAAVAPTVAEGLRAAFAVEQQPAVRTDG